MKSSLRVAVIGVGNMGKNHARVYRDLPGCELVAVADAYGDLKAFEETYRCSAYEKYEEMLKEEDIDAISVCVPTFMHKEVALHCLEAGAHLLLEKPIASSVEEAQEIEAAAEENGKLLFIGHIERFNPAVLVLKKLLKKKAFGDIVSVIIRRVGVFPPQIKDADIVVDVGIHDIDLLRYLFGKELTVVGATGGKAINNDRTDYYQALIDVDGVSCILQGNWITPIKIRNLSITGSEGYAELDFVTQQIRRYKTIKATEFDGFGDFVIKFGEPEIIAVDVTKGEPLKEEIVAFIDCIQHEKESAMPASEAILALQTAYDIKEQIEK